MPRPKSEITMNDVVPGIPEHVRKKKKLAGGKLHKLDPASGVVKPVANVLVGADGQAIDPNANPFQINPQEEVDAYNNAIKKLDPRFSEEITIFGRNVLVRVFLDSTEVVTASGLFLAKTNMIANPKKGTGMYGEKGMEHSNFPYTTAGIVVNVGTDCDGDIKAGDFVVLTKRAIAEIAVQGTGNTEWVNQFTHYNDAKISNADNTGYILIHQMEIVGKINTLRI
jgi:hypothetical protein